MMQEQRLEQQRREMEEHARQIKVKQEQELQRATSNRLLLEKQQSMVSRLFKIRSLTLLSIVVVVPL